LAPARLAPARSARARSASVRLAPVRSVPEGFFVIHKDGNTLNDEISNLELADRKRHIELIRKRVPEIYKKIGLSRSRTCRLRRKIRERMNIKQLINHQQDERHKKLVEESLGQIIESWYCAGCGEDYGQNPPHICPKCNGIWFKKIIQRIKVAV